MEINMEFDSLRPRVQIVVKAPDLGRLWEYGMKLSNLNRLSFVKKYGNILELLKVNIQEEAISALVQYYDPPLRCFTFQDFQLAPTLEEYEQILDLSLEEYKPYNYLEQYASIQTIASAIGISSHDLQQKLHNRGQVRGFTREFLEEHLNQLANVGDWDNYMSVLAMIIYGLVLFPHSNNFVDLDAIDVFLARKNKAENPVTALLADLYSTLTFCHEKKKKRLLCCLPILYIWLTSHVIQRNVNIKCPIADCVSYPMKKKGKQEWADLLASLTEKKVRWHPSWQQRTKLIYNCKSHLNVPLLGTRSCINYNPIFGQQQLAYPIKEPPKEEMLTPIYFYYAEGQYTEEIQRVREAWEKVTYKGKELGVRSCVAKEEYKQWVRERVKKIKLPFRRPTVMQSELLAGNESFEEEEVKNLKVKLAAMTEANSKMQAELLKARQDCTALARDNAEKQSTYESLRKKQKANSEYTFKIHQSLQDANKELGLRVIEKNVAAREIQELKETLEQVKNDRAVLMEENRRMTDTNIRLGDQRIEALNKIILLEVQVDELEEKVAEMIKYCQERDKDRQEEDVQRYNIAQGKDGCSGRSGEI